MNAAFVADLVDWTVETHAPLPLPVHEIVWRERCGAVVDLVEVRVQPARGREQRVTVALP